MSLSKNKNIRSGPISVDPRLSLSDCGVAAEKGARRVGRGCRESLPGDACFYVFAYTCVLCQSNIRFGSLPGDLSVRLGLQSLTASMCKPSDGLIRTHLLVNHVACISDLGSGIVTRSVAAVVSGGMVLLTEILLPRIARKGTACLISTRG